jgi:WD40 repeat protein
LIVALYGIANATFSLNGQYLLSGQFDNSVQVWDIANGQEIQEQQGHSAKVTRISAGRWAVHIFSNWRLRAIGTKSVFRK